MALVESGKKANPPSRPETPAAGTSKNNAKKADATDKDVPTLLGSPSQQDMHPFARGSVIEVYHFDNKDSQDDWWSEPDSDIDESDTSHRTIRLSDVIDRAQTDGVWRYYVHYRDFNRRMDEWVSLDRIVSPPSVGNAKARALKKEEEKLKRIQQKKEEEEKIMQESEAAGRRKRMRRKTSVINDDDGTVVAGNVQSGGEEEDNERKQGNMQKKEEVALPSDAITHKVGEHVVATVKAQELDEHEGLDEASLREHEEVTKVKNVAFLELGQ